MQEFQLAQRLADDCEFIIDWPLCRVLLMQDAHYPWFILVPRRNNLRELHQLTATDEQQYLRESRALSQYLLKSTGADKLNIAALGNVEPQLHIHHIARFQTDVAWPKPVWGQHPAKPYEIEQLHDLAQTSRLALQAAIQTDGSA